MSESIFTQEEKDILQEVLNILYNYQTPQSGQAWRFKVNKAKADMILSLIGKLQAL